MNLYREHYYLPGWTNIKTFHDKKFLTAHFLVKAFMEFSVVATRRSRASCFLFNFGWRHALGLFTRKTFKKKPGQTEKKTSRGYLTFACHYYIHDTNLLFTAPSSWASTSSTTGKCTWQQLSDKCKAARNCHRKMMKERQTYWEGFEILGNVFIIFFFAEIWWLDQYISHIVLAGIMKLQLRD